MSKGTGARHTYQASYDKVWKAAIAGLSSIGLAVAADNKADGYILAQRGMTPFSYGENVAVFVTRKSKRETEVEVVSKKAMETNLFAPDWSDDVFNGIEQHLK